MINNALSQTKVAAPIPVADGFPGGEGIQFDDDPPEEQQLDVIKRKILEKLTVRLSGQSLHRAFNDQPSVR